MFRLILHCEPLFLQRAVQGVLEELPQIRDRQHARRDGLTVTHGFEAFRLWSPSSTNTTAVRG